MKGTKMKIFTAILIIMLCSSQADARGGMSSGGRGGFSSGRSYSAPRSAPASRSYSAPSRTVTTTTTTRSSSVGRGYGGAGYYGGYGHPMMMGGFGMGYGYSNGLITGMILGNLMHPTGTTVYSGGGYSGQALLYPDGRVVNQEGYQVGTYQNGQFAAQQGGMVAQPAPQPPTPVVIEPTYTAAQIVAGVFVVILIVIILGVCLA